MPLIGKKNLFLRFIVALRRAVFGRIQELLGAQLEGDVQVGPVHVESVLLYIGIVAKS